MKSRIYLSGREADIQSLVSDHRLVAEGSAYRGLESPTEYERLIDSARQKSVKVVWHRNAAEL